MSGRKKQEDVVDKPLSDKDEFAQSLRLLEAFRSIRSPQDRNRAIAHVMRIARGMP